MMFRCTIDKRAKIPTCCISKFWHKPASVQINRIVSFVSAMVDVICMEPVPSGSLLCRLRSQVFGVDFLAL